jgi:hypothetical protein
MVKLGDVNKKMALPGSRVTGAQICVGDEICASWYVVQIGFPSWGGQVGVFKPRYAGRGAVL